MKISIAATTDIGKERTNNEDAFLICPDLSEQNWSLSETPSYTKLGKYGSLLIVADGMGGPKAGEIASSMAIQSIQQFFSTTAIENALKNNGIKEFLHTCIIDADNAINQRMFEDPDTSGMGTTIVVCWIIENKAYIAWCGDSRCYVYNPIQGLKPLTKDHSLVQELIDKGEITEKEAFTHPDNSIITRGLGDFDAQSEPDIVTYSLKPNDTILMCSDGLCGFCTNDEISKILDDNFIDIKKCRDELLKISLDAGGYDNICIALASLIGDEQTAPLRPTTMQKLFYRLKRLLTFP